MKISLRKIGGLHFLKIGRLTLMGCWSKKPAPKPARTIWTLDEAPKRVYIKQGGKWHTYDEVPDQSYPCPLTWHQLRRCWDEQARRLHDDLSR